MHWISIFAKCRLEKIQGRWDKCAKKKLFILYFFIYVTVSSRKEQNTIRWEWRNPQICRRQKTPLNNFAQSDVNAHVWTMAKQFQYFLFQNYKTFRTANSFIVKRYDAKLLKLKLFDSHTGCQQLYKKVTVSYRKVTI